MYLFELLYNKRIGRPNVRLFRELYDRYQQQTEQKFETPTDTNEKAS